MLRLAYGDLTLMVPADNTEEIGLREVINDEEVEEVFAVLRKKEARMPTNWSRRFKNHVEKLKSGDIYQVAEVVRNLSIREKDKGLSAGEKRMLDQGPPDPRVRAHLRHRRHEDEAETEAQRSARRKRRPAEQPRPESVGDRRGRPAAVEVASAGPSSSSTSAAPASSTGPWTRRRARPTASCSSSPATSPRWEGAAVDAVVAGGATTVGGSVRAGLAAVPGRTPT